MNEVPGFVPVVIVGAGPVSVTAATFLAQYGVDCLVLDRWANVCTRSRVRFTLTTKSAALWAGWVSPSSSRAYRVPRGACSCGTQR